MLTEELASLPVTNFSGLCYRGQTSLYFIDRMNSKVLRLSVVFLFWDVFPSFMCCSEVPLFSCRRSSCTAFVTSAHILLDKSHIVCCTSVKPLPRVSPPRVFRARMTICSITWFEGIPPHSLSVLRKVPPSHSFWYTSRLSSCSSAILCIIGYPNLGTSSPVQMCWVFSSWLLMIWVKDRLDFKLREQVIFIHQLHVYWPA